MYICDFTSKVKMSCLFPDCENTRHFCQNTGIKFFKFPTQMYMRQKWLNSCKLTESELPKVPLVCSLHFGSEDIVQGKVCKLNKNAFPANERWIIFISYEYITKVTLNFQTSTRINQIQF